MPESRRTPTALAYIGAVAAVALLAAIAALFLPQQPSHAPLPAKQRAALAVSLAQQPNPACNPAIGAGHMGVCAPQTPEALRPLLGAPSAAHGIFGVDVSSYQGCPNLSGVSFAFTKLVELTYRNPYASCAAQRAKAAHVPLGGYAFLRAGHLSACAEARLFVSYYRALHLSGPAVADVEVNDRGLSPAAMRAHVAGWVHCVHASLPHATVLIYTGAWFWNPQVAGSAGTSNLWVSAYVAGGYRLVPVGFRSALIWQNSDGRVGPLPHIHGYDTDVFQGSRSRLRAVFAGHAAAVPITAGQRARCAELTRIRLHHKRTGRWEPKGRGVAIKRGEARNHLRCSNGSLSRTR